MSGAQTKTTVPPCSTPRGFLYSRAGCQSADLVVVLSQPACIDQWTRRPLTETTINRCRSREPAKVLRTERAGLERNKPLRYSAMGAPIHVGANGAKPEHLSPLQGGAVIEMSACTTSVEAAHVPKKCSVFAPHRHAPKVGKDGVRGRKPLAVVFPRLRRP